MARAVVALLQAPLARKCPQAAGQVSVGTHEHGRQAPDLQLLGGRLLGATARAVVALLQALLAREGAQAAGQVYGTRGRCGARRNRSVLHKSLPKHAGLDFGCFANFYP